MGRGHASVADIFRTLDVYSMQDIQGSTSRLQKSVLREQLPVRVDRSGLERTDPKLGKEFLSEHKRDVFGYYIGYLKGSAKTCTIDHIIDVLLSSTLPFFPSQKETLCSAFASADRVRSWAK